MYGLMSELTDRQRNVQKALSYFRGLSISLTKIRYLSDASNWSAVGNQTRIVNGKISKLNRIGALDGRAYRQLSDKVDYLESQVDRRDTEGVSRAVGEVHQMIEQYALDDISKYCLNPKAVAFRRGVRER